MSGRNWKLRGWRVSAITWGRDAISPAGCTPRALEETQAVAYPDWEISDWLRLAKRVMTLAGNGRIVFDYDMKIAEPFRNADFSNQPSMWPGFDALADKPMLILRGELSDLFSAATLSRMAERAAGAETVTVPRVGHAPTLDEPEAVAAIGRLVARAG